MVESRLVTCFKTRIPVFITLVKIAIVKALICCLTKKVLGIWTLTLFSSSFQERRLETRRLHHKADLRVSTKIFTLPEGMSMSQKHGFRFTLYLLLTQ